MADPLIPPAELAPTVPPGATPEQCIALWVEWMDVCEQFLLAGLRRQIGPDGDLREAYRQWYAEQMKEHDRMIQHMIDRFNRRGGGRAR